jgi:hypothetical protein
MNQKLASSLKRTAEVNVLLVKHYNDYPSNPNGFTEWQNDLMKIMENPLK